MKYRFIHPSIGPGPRGFLGFPKSSLSFHPDQTHHWGDPHHSGQHQGWSFLSKNFTTGKCCFWWGIWVFPKIGVPWGAPKSSILIGFSIINHPFWGTIILVGGWILNQPLWKICSSNWIIFPKFRGENDKKYLRPPARFFFGGGIPSLKLTWLRTWKWMVGILSRFLLGPGLFSGAMSVSGRV